MRISDKFIRLIFFLFILFMLFSVLCLARPDDQGNSAHWFFEYIYAYLAFIISALSIRWCRSIIRRRQQGEKKMNPRANQ